MYKKILVAIDIQREYTTPGRPFYLECAGPSLVKAQQVLATARQLDWPIIHVKHLQSGSVFNPNSFYSNYVEEFRPIPGEIQITKSKFSCYSNAEFAQIAAEEKENEFVVIGYGSTMCCLATIIDGYHRGQRLAFVYDASSARRTVSMDELTAHRAATDIISIYSKVISAGELFAKPLALKLL